MNNEITFIIPVHNAEKVLYRAVSSIVEQKEKHHNFQILIIENSSTDSTLKKAKELERKHGFVSVLYSNKGVSNARNIGLKNVITSYVFFLDADDFLVEGSLQKLYSQIEKHNSDLICFNFEKNYKKVRILDKSKVLKTENEIISFKKEILENPTNHMTVWSKLFKKSIIDEFQIYFDPSLSFAEDSDFFFRYLQHSKSIELSDNFVYHYSIDLPSTTRNKHTKKVTEYCNALNAFKSNFKDERSDLFHSLNYYILINFIVLMVKDVFNSKSLFNFKNEYIEMLQVLNLNPFKESISHLTLLDSKNKKMIILLLIKYHFSFLAALVFKCRVLYNSRIEKENND